MKETLFQEFPEVSTEQWKQQIGLDLKGADYDEKLVYRSLDGIEVQPFYTSQDVRTSIELPPPKQWKICEHINVETAAQGNELAKQALEKGAESLWFTLALEINDLNALFEGLDLQSIPVYLNLNFLSKDYVQKLRSVLPDKSPVYLQTDPIGHLAATGNYFFDQKKDFQVLNSLIENASGYRSLIGVDLGIYQNAGANIPQQLAFALAHYNEYLNEFSQKGQIPKKFKPQFLVAVGSNYFFEIAKIRALRQLYAYLAREYDLPQTCFILAQPTKRDKTLYDYNVNLLRTTTQCMSAVLGGVDAVSNLPYDVLFHRHSEFGGRIARNQLLVMKHEAYLDKVANAADGAYYIESLTSQFASAALEILRKIEQGGGFLKMLLAGKIQKMIAQSAEKEQALFDKGELILIGTNKFANPQDQMKNDLEFDPFKKIIAEDTLIEPLLPGRLSEKAEKERLQKEQEAQTES